MKKVLLLIAFIHFGYFSFGQSGGICDPVIGAYSIYPLASIDFSGGPLSKAYFQIDTTLPNNLWQTGTVTKSGFQINEGGFAIQTDTSLAYDTNNKSVFYVWTDSIFFTTSLDSIVSLQFWHYYDVDSIGDSCFVQMTLDSGKTWLNYSDYGPLPPVILYDYQAPSNLLPNVSGKFLWNGLSQGWQQVKICFMYYGLKPSRSISWPVGFRFLFISDSIQNNKPGWVIEDVRFMTPIYTAGINDYSNKSLSIYPNPSSDGWFAIDYPSNYVTGKFYVYDYFGRNVKTIPLTKQIDLSSLPFGVYLYRAQFEKTNQWFSGKLEIR